MPSHAAKDLSQPMADAYHPALVESGWDGWWCDQGLYRPRSDFDSSPIDPSHPPFTIVIPPPNVTGTLHLGHALTCAVEDAIVRWQRMRGRDVLWLPGTDHAGIATQVVVEKKLMKDSRLSRHDLGRDAFVAEVWQWKALNGDRIKQQIRRLGASVDWSREAFTMDDNLSRAVQRAFITLHGRGLIYRSNRLVNWSCALRTAISSIEVEHIDLDHPTPIKVPGYSSPIEFGVIHSFAYPLDDGSSDAITVSTTRIETMLGDVAVAVHPDDERYRRFHGKTLKHPFLPHRRVAIITDPVLVDMAFGTGAVKVTPAHDPNDFDCGARHALASINIFTDDGLINDNGGEFAGLKRFDARAAVIDRLSSLGLYRGKAANKMSLGICSRSKDIVEPVIRPQWWVSCADMAKRAADAVRQEELRIVPPSFEKTWYAWLDNIQDWCISRQLWWGHRIPAYHVSVPSDPSFATHSTDENVFWVTGNDAADALIQAHRRFPHVPTAAIVLRQDEDVLDTWFSSGLFPFSTMGWPEQTTDLARFYPGTLLETGHDILFFWVARMVMMGLELTDVLPFTTVYLHAMVRDKFGRKMCWGRGTRLLMWDGSSKAVEDVEEGDVLTGDDSTPRTVQTGSLTQGLGQMFQVELNNGGRDVWTCNDSHVLVLRINRAPRVEQDRLGMWRVQEWRIKPGQDQGSGVPTLRTVGTAHSTQAAAQQALNAHMQGGWAGPLVFECTVRDFVKLSGKYRDACTMFQPDLVQFNPPTACRSLAGRLQRILGVRPSAQLIEDTAWTLGMWLADGEAAMAYVGQIGDDNATGRHHTPVIRALERWYTAASGLPAQGIAHFNRYTSVGNEFYVVHLGQILDALLVSYSLKGNKHFPTDLLRESERVRLALYAGVVDGDGNLQLVERCHRLSAKERSFLDGFIHLSRGLGFSAGVAYQTEVTGEDGTVYQGWKVTIGGSIERSTPWLQLQYKACPARVLGVNFARQATSDGFSITLLPGQNDYFGFQLDGNARCLLADFVVTHNSKSLGNVVDPLDVISGITLEALHAKLLEGNLPASEVEQAKEGQKRDFPDGISECGADALRFGLLAYSSQGRDVNLDIQRVVAYRQFGNKLWQATRFALLNFDASFVKPSSLADVRALVDRGQNLADRWILSRLCAAVVRANGGFEGYQFAEVTTAVYNFWLYELCDVYLELIKPIVKTADSSPAAAASKAASLAVLYTCLRTGLLLLHPLMPFISEELYHRLPQAMGTEEEKAGVGGRLQCGSIMVQPYPSEAEFGAFASADAEALMATLQDVGKAARSTRSNLGLTKKRVELYLLCSDDAAAASLIPHTRDLGTLAIASAVHVLPASQRASIPNGCTTSIVSPTLELHIPLRGLVDFGAEVVKMEKQRDALLQSSSVLRAKMAAPGYDKSPADVRSRNEAKLRDDAAEVEKLTASIDAFNALMSDDEKAQYLEQKVSAKRTDAERAKVAMDKILPAGGDEAKLNKKIAGKYSELKKEHAALMAELEQLQQNLTIKP